MALGTLIGSLAASAGGALISKAFAGKDKGGATSKSSLAKTSPLNFSAGGLKGSFNNKSKTYSVGSDADRSNLVGQISSTFGSQAGMIRGLRERVAPGVSDLRASRLGQVENARTAAIGNLRENLQRRRVLGSSFASDTLARAELEFGQEKQRVEAESFLTELDMTQKFLQQEFEATRAQFQTNLGELNLHAELAAKLTGMASTQMSAASQLEMELAMKQMDLGAKSAEGAGRFFGDNLQPAIADISKWATGFFQPDAKTA